MELQNHLANLNEAQHAAVTFPAQAALQVLSGPGSGKTRTLTSRVANLILVHHISPKDIICVTFTNKAANEMKHRLKPMLGERSVQQLVIGTFHSVSVRYLRRHGTLIGIPQNFLICDHNDSVNLIKRLTNEASVLFTAERLEPPKHHSVAETISKAKAKGLSPSAYRHQSEKNNNQMGVCVARIYEDYQEKLKKDNALDFDDLLTKGHELFRDHQRVLANIKVVLVDEFQDTNYVQYEMVKSMAKKTKALTIVGDPDQSIYGWRSAEVAVLEYMLEDFKPCVQIYLEENYRSTGAILAASLAVVSQDKQRIQKQLFTSHGKGLAVVLRQLPSPQMEAAYIGAEIKRLIAHTGGQLNYDDFAVLLRYNSLSRTIEGAFQTAGVPNRVLGGSKFFERAEVKDILAYLQLVESPGYSLGFERVINVPKRSIGAATVVKIRDAAAGKNCSMMDVVTRSLRGSSIADLKPNQKKSLKPFVEAIGKLKTLAEKGASVPELIDLICETIQYEAHLDRTYGNEKEARMQNIQELKSYAKQVTTELGIEEDEDRAGNIPSSQTELAEEDTIKAEGNDDAEDDIGLDVVLDLLESSQGTEKIKSDNPLRSFLAATQLSTDLTVEEEDETERKPKVTISTTHSSKGLEWPVVFVPCCEDGIFPFFRADTAEQIDEERRLLYVAMTRAQVSLYLTHVRARMVGAETKSAVLSPFLKPLAVDKRYLVANQPDTLTLDTRSLINTVLRRQSVAEDMIATAIAEHTRLNPVESSWDLGLPDASQNGRAFGNAYRGFQTATPQTSLPQINAPFSQAPKMGYRPYTASQASNRLGSSSQPVTGPTGFGKASSMLSNGFSSASTLLPQDNRSHSTLGSKQMTVPPPIETRLSRITSATLLNPDASSSAAPGRPNLGSFQAVADDSISFLKALAKEDSIDILDWQPSSSSSPDKAAFKPTVSKSTTSKPADTKPAVVAKPAESTATKRAGLAQSAAPKAKRVKRK